MKPLKLQTPPPRKTPGRLYCAPFCICAITQQPYEDIVRPAINRRRYLADNAPIRGVRALGQLPAEFDDGYPVPKRYHAEAAKYRATPCE